MISPCWEFASREGALDNRRAVVESGIPIRAAEFVEVVAARPGHVEQYRSERWTKQFADAVEDCDQVGS